MTQTTGAMSEAVADGQAQKEETGYIYLIYFLVVLYAFCYQLQAPLEPFLVERLVGKDKGSNVAVAYGHLQSFFMVIQTVGSLTFGYLLDRVGVRLGFIVNFIASAMTYLLLANTSSLEMLYLSKVPGIAMAGFLCAQTAVSQLTPAGSTRIAALGRLTTAYTIGGVIGPYSGGLLGAKGDYFLSAKIAVAGSLLAAGLSCLLPSDIGTASSQRKDSSDENGKTKKVVHEEMPLSRRVSTVFEVAGFLILVKLLTSIANSMASSSQALILKNTLGFSEADMGFFMSAQFAFGGFANGFLLAPVTRLLGGKANSVVRNCIAIMGVGYILQAMLGSSSSAAVDGVSRQSPYVFIAIAMLLSIFQYSLGTSITAETTQMVPEDMKGTLIGMEHGIFSAARIFTPSIGTSILNSAGVSALYMACASIFFSVLGLWTALGSRLLPREVKDR